MSRFSDFFEENKEEQKVLESYPASSLFMETVKLCKVLKDFEYEERGIKLTAGTQSPICTRYITKYADMKVIEALKGEEYRKKIDWQIQKVSPEKVKELRKKAEKKEQVTKGRYQKNMDTDEYLDNLTVESLVYPDLRDIDLQNSYGVRSAVSLLYKMVDNAGELEELKIAVSRANGFDDRLEEMEEEAKN